MVVELRFPHEAHTTDEALVRLLVTMDKSVRIPVISAIEGLSTNFTLIRFLSCMYSSVFFEMFRINKSGTANLTFERPLSSVRRFDVVVEETSPLETFTALYTLIPLVVVVSRSLM